MTGKPVTVILLAAQRAGVVNPLAARAGVSHKCLVPICGRPLIDHVLDTLSTIPEVGEIHVSLEPEAHEAVERIFDAYRERGPRFDLVPNDRNIIASVLAAAKARAGPFVITTADNVLLTADGFAQMVAALDGADAVIGVARRKSVLAAHPEGQRNSYKLRDGEYANCNIYALSGHDAFAATELFRKGGQFQAKPGRLMRAIGPWNIVLYLLRRATMEEAFQRIGARFGVKARVVTFADGSLAIDVDNERTYACCEAILKQREAVAGGIKILLPGKAGR
ncbi:NTP transferase domain-containing protein [Altererythrobacter salegens]|uniref:NTP transferase domain-containing protein n=1 Tax=Croceibacterium salegens TaxID=1737568 RepID=A0A6I4SWY1_9SPHN|nr:nucleotidyltransferase family protein [Croceibacterium salegens]MXO59547.1 NTP transferase domain-containing protein [Croceibacterium salegens]